MMRTFLSQRSHPLGGLLAVAAFCVLVHFSAAAYSGGEYGCPTPWGGISQSGVSDSENPPPVKGPARDGQAVEPSAPTDSSEVQQPETLRDWYIKHYDFYSMKDTVYTFETEFEFPDGYKRLDSADLTPFQNWISHFPLWHQWKPVGMWRGNKVFEADQVSRAVHLPWKGIVFRDYAIPLRILAEFLRYQHCEFDLHVIPKLGDTLRYEDWLKGKPFSSSGGEVFFKPSEQREHDPYEYYSFLNLCMRSTSYPSLAENCDSITENEVAPGDLFIAHDEKGKTGSVYVILNMLVNNTGEKLFAVATGCPEACDFHIPLFNNNRDYPWITSKRIKALGKDIPHSGYFRFRVK